MEAVVEKPERATTTASWPGPIHVLLLAACCGLVAGELEVAVRVAQRSFRATERLYLMTRHFVWLVPLLNLLLFLAFGALCALATWRWPRRGGWLSVRIILLWAILPSLMLVGRGMYSLAILILAMGLAAWLAPTLERGAAGSRRRLLVWTALVAGAVLIQWGWLVGGETQRRWREEARALPPAGSPDVLLIVLDTVRADHLSVYGYDRPTTPNLEALAQRAIRFDQARAAAPWTLASHATLFTGRWPHELATRWMCPMRGDVPTLAEYLGSLGYATAGFVGNTFYCAYDSGLDRGFAQYRDYRLDWLSALRTVHLVDSLLQTIHSLAPALGRSVGNGPDGGRLGLTLRQFAQVDRKDAGVVNREFLDWLMRRPDPRRPFFAFLNYVDAHAPYTRPPGTAYRFGRPPATEAAYVFLSTGWMRANKTNLPWPVRAMAVDAYDNCVASIDDRLGELFGELRRRGLLEHTVAIVTADHAEGFGEHGLFDHGECLYRPEVRVPLLISLPSGQGAGRVVDRFVSLRDIPATIAELVGSTGRPPFPGRSLARMWRDLPSGSGNAEPGDLVLSELEAPNPIDPNHGRSPAKQGPLISLADGEFVYIRNDHDGREELFHEREDPGEFIDRSKSGSHAMVIARFRDFLRRLRPGADNVPPGSLGAGLSRVSSR
jgi:arylsulfatase A-like enzyme